MTKISHSARGKYDHCARMYRLHYVDKIRPVGTTSSLVFGSAIDKAAENYLLEANPEHAINIFKQEWNNVKKQQHTEIEFHRNDFDHELLTESDNVAVIKDTIHATTSSLVEANDNKEKVTLANWVSLYRKGLILINSFIEWVDKNVEEVLEAQCDIELEDDEGNEITGKADFVLKLKWYDKPLLVDLKTAARYYERGSVKTSEQLALYYFYLKNTKYPDMERASYLVLQKQIKKNRVKTCQKCGNVTTGKEQSCAAEFETGELIAKGKNKGSPKLRRCDGEFDEVINPEGTVQFLYDEIPQEFIDETIEDFGVVISKIKSGEFEMNLEGCANYYGRECPYLKYCAVGCMDGLVKKEDSK